MMTTSKPQEGKWYATRLVFRSQVGEAVELDPLCEDRVVLFFAPDEPTARKAALRYGQEEEHRYRNEDGELVEWRFAGIEQLEELGPDPELAGWEVSFRFFRPSDLERAKANEG